MLFMGLRFFEWTMISGLLVLMISSRDALLLVSSWFRCWKLITTHFNYSVWAMEISNMGGDTPAAFGYMDYCFFIRSSHLFKIFIAHYANGHNRNWWFNCKSILTKRFYEERMTYNSLSSQIISEWIKNVFAFNVTLNLRKMYAKF